MFIRRLHLPDHPHIASQQGVPFGHIVCFAIKVRADSVDYIYWAFPRSSPEFDSSRHFRKSAFNEINNLEAIFAFWCGGTLLPY